MQANSRQVFSKQSRLHPKLAKVVRRHLHSRYRRPVAPHNLSSYAQLSQELALHPRPLVLDSFCGTGLSSAQLAQRHPDHLVVGIDKSGRRLGRHPGGSRDNYLLLRADCEDLWLLLTQDGLAVDYHYLFYPNPWPRARQLQRRVHGHGSFPLLLALGGRIELRSNWQLYVEEFGVAMHLAGCPGSVSRVSGEPAISLFEDKYRHSGHALWAFTGTVPVAPVAS